MSAETADRTGRPARILGAARELAIRQGIQKTTMAQVASRAHVAKGTAYSYWPSKESLFLELIAWTFRDILTDLESALESDPSRARPGAMMVDFVRAAFDQELTRALLSSDDEVLGVLVDTPEATELVTTHGAIPLFHELLPIWRDHGLADPASPLEEQSGALELLTMGYFTARERMEGLRRPPSPEHVLDVSVARVLGGSPDRDGDSVPQTLVNATRVLLRDHVDSLVSSISDLGRSS